MSEERCWHLTNEETTLIKRYLDFYRSLDSGSRTPSTSAQLHFVAVCRCRAGASTPHEVAYCKYRMLIAKQQDQVERADDEIGGYGDGVPTRGWFTDEAWKRMRGQYLSNSE